MVQHDANFVEHLAHFDRERIPERVVHAKGAGAFGEFVVTHDITKYTKARVFEMGKKTKILVRFSTSIGGSSSADTLRDGRGFAIKFYTDEGNWDLVGNHLPMFPIRDAILFPSLIRSRKRNPTTHLHNDNTFWDFNSLRPETTFHTLLLMSDFGIPDGYRKMDGAGVHTFKLVNALGHPVYVKFHWKSNQGLKNLEACEAAKLAGEDPDYAIRDLYNAIENKDFPAWTFGVQIMSFEEAERYHWDPFDPTKIWLESDFPFMPVGTLTLNENQKDFFTQIEQAAFSPSHMIPGIEAGPDRLLEGRMFAYPDTMRHRLGANFLQIPVNRPKFEISTYQKDGPMCMDDNGAGAPNYFPNSFGGPEVDHALWNETVYRTPSTDVVRQDIGDLDNYALPKWYWRNFFDDGKRDRFVQTVAASLQEIEIEIQTRVIENMWKPVDPTLERRIKEEMQNPTAKTPELERHSGIGRK